MEQMTTYLSSLGACGFIAYTLFKKLVSDSENDKNYYRTLIENNQKMYQEELKADRQIYINSITAVVSRLENVEQDINEIKEIIKK